MKKKRFLKKIITAFFLIGFFFIQDISTANVKARVAGVVRRAAKYFDDSKVKVEKKLDDWQRRRAVAKKRFELPRDIPLDESTKQLILTEKGKDWFLYSKEAGDWFKDPAVTAWIKEDEELFSLYTQRYTGPAEPYLERVKNFFKNKFPGLKVKKSEKEIGLSE